MRSYLRIIFTLIALIGTAGTSFACSVCQCGDNLFCPLDRQSRENDPNLPLLLQPHEFRAKLQNTYLSKSNALDPEEGIGSESLKEFRPSLRLGYGITDQLSVAAELPFSFKTNEATDQEGSTRERSSGLGDLQMSAVWTQPFGFTAAHGYAAGLAVALKLPTGRNNLQRNGERLDEHLQTGTGSYDWQTGVSLSRSAKTTTLFTSVYYKHMGTNSYNYHFGNAVLYNLGLLYHLSHSFTLSAQINGRAAKKDVEGVEAVENTGGSVTYIAPGVKIPLMPSASFLLNVQVPLYQNLYGTQSEKTVVNTGISLNIL